MKDLLLDPTTHDLLIQENDLVICTDADQLMQNLKVRLQFFRGDWFLDVTSGVPYYEDILVKNPNLPNVDNIIKAEIVETPGVTEILEYTSQFNRQLRTYTISFKCNSEFGLIELSNTAIGVP